MIWRYIAVFSTTVAMLFCICCVDIARKENAKLWKVVALIVMAVLSGAAWLWNIYQAAMGHLP